MNTTTYVYEIVNLITRDDLAPRTDNVIRVICSVTATDPSERTISSGVAFELEAGETFIPFADLDEATVRSWVDAQTDQWYVIKYGLNAQLEQQSAQLPKTQMPPWLPTPEEQHLLIIQHLSTATTATSTATTVGIQTPQISEDYLKALIYEVLEEINQNNV
jgi:hypothetical protein